ncbi:MAG: hypothetical protein LC105_09905 [Chitinophagales bacterium]|nr:hypothetical protein [Chitinophagales bacterium]MCZ2394160.1 hypothetical protein [Chitinophagales bacterium]
MKQIFLGIMILLSFLIIQCAAINNATEPAQLQSAIKGKWNIEYEECCGRTNTVTYGGSQAIHFNIKNQTYRIYHGSEIQKSGNYSLSADEKGTMIQLEDRFPAILRITDGLLYIDWSYMDLKREVYKR